VDLLSRRPWWHGASRRPLPARTRRWRKLLGRALLAAFLVAVVGLLVWQARQIAWADVWSALRETPGNVLLAASLAAFCGHLAYSMFDLVGRRYTQHKLPTLPIQGVTFTSYAFNLNFGAIVGGAAMRLRLYARLGLPLGTIVRVMALSMWTNWLGYLFLVGVLLLSQPLAPPESWPVAPWALRGLGVLALAVALAYVAVCAALRRHRWRLRWKGQVHQMHVPSGGMALIQLVLGCATWLAMAGVIYLLLQERVPFAPVAFVHLVGVVSGLVTRVPAGLGVQEAVFVALLSDQVPTPELLAALLGYRALYYWAPLALALLAYLWMELRAKQMARRAARVA
jgi:glycosyltransferase 2 family protein